MGLGLGPGGDYICVGIDFDARLGGGQGLGHLAVVAVDGDGLDAHLPGIDVQLFYVLDRHLLGKVDGFGDGPGNERLDGAHHPHVAQVVDGVVPHRTGEHGQMFGSQVRGADDRTVHVDVGDDLVDLVGRVPEPGQGPGYGLVDDGHGATTHQLLGLDQTEVGLDSGGVTIHQQPDGAGRCEHAGLRVAHAVQLAELDGQIPRLLSRRQEVGGDSFLVDVGHGVAVHAQHIEHGLDVVVVAGEGPIRAAVRAEVA